MPIVRSKAYAEQQQRLSWAAAGLYAYLCHYKLGKTFRVGELYALSRTGRQATFSALQELVVEGLVMKAGRTSHKTYMVPA